jgi:hypothetical protein
MRKIITIFTLVAGLSGMAAASNLANPIGPLPDACMSIGASYQLDGISITNREIPALLNRFQGRLSYAPISFVNFGVDLGATQMEVAADTSASDTLGVFHGRYGFSFGAHLKATTPLFIKGVVGLIGIAQGTSFTSENSRGALYRGYDAAGAAGLLFRVSSFGYVAAGSKVYLIARGFNQSYNSTGEQRFGNVNNVRGWLAVDFYPPMKTISSGKPYISLELSVSPLAQFNGRAPVQEVSFSVAIGAITNRLYGK